MIMQMNKIQQKAKIICAHSKKCAHEATDFAHLVINNHFHCERL